jgi:hypothetical protein
MKHSRRHGPLNEEQLCVLKIAEESKALLLKLLHTNYGKPVEDPEIGRACFVFLKNGKPVAKLCIASRPETYPELRNTLVIYNADTLKDICDHFEVMLG